MFIKSEKHNPNYLAKFVQINNLRKHANADRLQVSTIDGNDVITGTDIKEGDYVVYFPLECAISKKFLSATDSFEDKTLNTNKEKKGFFNSKGRVRAVKLRGQPSMGYIVPVEVFFNWINAETASSTYVFSPSKDLNVEFDAFVAGDKQYFVCKKYVNKQDKIDKNKEKQANQKYKAEKVSKLIDNQFRLHCDTPQFGKSIFKFHPEDIIAITHKLHGTSGVFSKVLCKKPLKWYQKLFKKVGIEINETHYDSVYSSRKVIKNKTYSDKEVTGGFYGEDIWGVVAKELDPFIEQGMTLYCEIVGYLESGKMVQSGYDYGCEEGRHDTYVYRITTTMPNGTVYEWSTPQIVEWCTKKGIKHVPLYYYGTAGDRFPDLDTEAHWQDEFLNKMKQTYLEKMDPICNNQVPDEGVCIRRESLEIDTYKLKSFAFLQKESADLDKGEVDIESQQADESIA